jgi:hypothetical protein
MAAGQIIDPNTLPIKSVINIIDLILDRKDRFSRTSILDEYTYNLSREDYITLLAQAYLIKLKNIYFTNSIPNNKYKNFLWKVLQKGFRIFKYDRYTPYSDNIRKEDLNSLSRFLTTFNEEARATDFKLNIDEQRCYDMMLNVVDMDENFGNTMGIFILQALEQAVDSKQIDAMKQKIDDTCIDVKQKGGKRKTRSKRSKRKTRKN